MLLLLQSLDKVRSRLRSRDRVRSRNLIQFLIKILQKSSYERYTHTQRMYTHSVLGVECWEVDPDHNSRPNSVFYSRHIWCMDSSAGTGYRHLDLDVQLLLHPLDPSTTQPQPHHEMCSCMVINNAGLGHTDISLPRAYTCHYKSPTQGFLKATYKSRSLNLLLFFGLL